MSIHVVLFDIGGVIVKWKEEWLYKDVAKKFGLSEVLLVNEGKKELSNLRLGKISEPEMWQRIGAKINSEELSNIKESLIHDIFKSRISVDESIFAIIKQLQKKNIKIGILSNTTLVTHTIVEELIDMSYFNYQFLSYRIGWEKPDEKIFKYVTEQLPYSKKEILFIDDKISNVNAAKEFGIKAIHFTDTSQFIADLNSLEIL
jgi:putative hydrolase of the HAD superfamily